MEILNEDKIIAAILTYVVYKDDNSWRGAYRIADTYMEILKTIAENSKEEEKTQNEYNISV